MSLRKKMNKETYDAISQLGTPSLIAEKLKEYDAEFREAYRKFGNALRNKAYRDKNKDEINKARNIKRNALKPITNNKAEITTEFINDIDTNVKPDYNINIPIKLLTPSTIRTYKNTIKNIYKKYNNKDLNDDNDILKFLDGKNKKQYSITKIKKDFKFIIQYSKDIAEKHFSSINILYSVFSRLEYGMKDIKNSLYPYVIAKNKYYQDNRHKIICNQDAIDNISFETDDVLKNIDKIDNPYDKLLFALLFLIPTRRIHDYRYTKIAYKKKQLDIKEFNWYYQGKIYINNTKNKKSIVLDLPIPITDLINNLPDDTEYLLGKFYSESTLSNKFLGITKIATGFGFTATDIRKLYSTYNLKKGGNYCDLVANAEKQGHSLIENLKYAIKTDN
jgi:hypothetical protein